MQPPASSSSSSSGHDPIRGSSSSSGSGLARFRSAPASASASASSWLESLLNDADEDLALKPSPSLQYHGGSLTQLLTSGACSTSTSSTTTTSYGAASSSSGPRVSSSYRSIIESPNLGFLDLGGGVDHSATNLTFARQNSSPADFLGGGHDDGYFAGFGIPASYDYLGSSSSPGKPVREDSDSQHRFVSGLTEEEQRSGSLQSGVDGFLDVGMDKLLEDFVPCRVRAKRGCATHPRSISERVRRTRISDRIKKLQELVPNMDKQTNTADMLEEAVEYVKRLQKQIQELTEQQKQCKCGASNRP